MKLLSPLLLLVLSSCVSLPEGVTPVNDFELQRYLGKWYEIARFDHSFERGLSDVTAEYSIREDGGVKVINRGYSEKKEQWKNAEGRAYFAQTPDTGYLKVSFFGPFYSSYVIVELDKTNYQYALVSGPNRKYLWILARNPVIKDDVRQKLEAIATSLGYDISKLIYVKQTRNLN